MNVFGFFSRVILYSALAGIVVIFGLVIFAISNAIQEPLDLVCVRMKGHSMEPVLMDEQNYIFDKDFRFNEIDINSIIAYHDTNYLNPNLIAHRVIAINGDYLVTRGEANGFDDAPVSFWQVVYIYHGGTCSL